MKPVEIAPPAARGAVTPHPASPSAAPGSAGAESGQDGRVQRRLSPIERAAAEYVTSLRVGGVYRGLVKPFRARGIDGFALAESRQFRAANTGLYVPERSLLTVLDPEHLEAINITRAAQDGQVVVCGEAAAAVDIIMAPDTSPDAKQAAWLHLHDFVGADLGIDVTAPPATILTTSSEDEVKRIDPPNYYESIMRVLRSRGWQKRAVWPVAYIKRATYRAAHQYCVRALQRQRRKDARHITLDDVGLDVLEVDSIAAVCSTMGIDCAGLLDALRATGRPADEELAEDLQRWLGGAIKADMGDARYQRMMDRIRKPRIRAMARRLGTEPVPLMVESRITGRGQKKMIMLHGESPTLPFGAPPSSWQPGYRTEEAAVLGVSPEWLVSMGYKVFGQK